ncbi:MAG: hypothetical protein AB1634_17990 [Thermodesulfobacteriota bacterium]
MREIVKYSAFMLVLLITGCAYNVELISFETGETLHGGFNVATHEVWVNMADGTRLSGKYVELRNDSISFGTTTGTAFAGTTFGSFSSFGTGYSIGSTSIGYAILRSPGTKLMMEVLVRANLDNTGMGEARTNDGRTYKVIF